MYSLINPFVQAAVQVTKEIHLVMTPARSVPKLVNVMAILLLLLTLCTSQTRLDLKREDHVRTSTRPDDERRGRRHALTGGSFNETLTGTASWESVCSPL